MKVNNNPLPRKLLDAFASGLTSSKRKDKGAQCLPALRPQLLLKKPVPVEEEAADNKKTAGGIVVCKNFNRYAIPTCGEGDDCSGTRAHVCYRCLKSGHTIKNCPAPKP